MYFSPPLHPQPTHKKNNNFVVIQNPRGKKANRGKENFICLADDDDVGGRQCLMSLITFTRASKQTQIEHKTKAFVVVVALVVVVFIYIFIMGAQYR